MIRHEPIRILSVDDDPAFVDMLSDMLEFRNEDLFVMTSTSAREGLQLLDEFEFDCVVSDFEMPGMNGLEFLHEVRQQCNDIPFIMLAGKGNEKIASKAESAGVTEYLQKGVGTDQFSVLAEVIRESTR